MNTSRTMRRVRAAGSSLVGSMLLVALAAAPASADPTSPAVTSWTMLTPVVPQLVDPFVPIIDIEAQRAEVEREEAQARRQRAEERRRKAEAADRSARAQRHSPVEGGYDLTARFGQGGGYWSGGRHTGLDFAASQGTGIRAVVSGRVVSAGWQGAYGQRIEIAHADGSVTSYSHLSSIWVGVGDPVDGGQPIGTMGSTGNATGTHLHLEVTTAEGGLIDPAAWLGVG